MLYSVVEYTLEVSYMGLNTRLCYLSEITLKKLPNFSELQCFSGKMTIVHMPYRTVKRLE